MVQRGSGLGFPLKASERMLIFGDILWQEFQSDEAVQAGIFRLVHHTHTAAAEFF